MGRLIDKTELFETIGLDNEMDRNMDFIVYKGQMYADLRDEYIRNGCTPDEAIKWTEFTIEESWRVRQENRELAPVRRIHHERDI